MSITNELGERYQIRDGFGRSFWNEHLPPTGFEPVAYGLGNRRSILVSYGGTFSKSNITDF